MESNIKYLVIGGTIHKILLIYNVESGSTRTEIKHSVKLFFLVIAMNSNLPFTRVDGPIMRHTMIITLQRGYYIPPLIEKNFKAKY